MEYKGSQTKIVDVDEKGVVVFYASVFNNKDKGNDIMEKGAFRKTIKENFKNIRHFKHHDSTQMPGVVQELAEDDKGLIVTSKLILGTQIGKETYEEYRAMAEADKSMDHSIGYWVTKFKEEREKETDEYTRWLKEVQLGEVSTLTAWGMNPEALTVDVKRYHTIDMDELLKEERYFSLLLKCDFPEAKLEQLEQLLTKIQTLIRLKADSFTLNADEPSSDAEAGTTTSVSELIKTINIKF
jgi:HK97 family phage prohead protease